MFIGNKILSSFKKIAPIALTGMLLLSCENDVQEIKDLASKKTGVEEGKNIESYLSDGGRMKAKLTAPLMLRYQFDTTMVEFPKSLHVDFYDSLTKVESQLNARYGRYLENDNKVFLRDSVVVFNRKGDTLWCSELYWDQAKRIFYTDKPAVLSLQTPVRQKSYPSGGLTADQNFKWVTLNKVGPSSKGDKSFINVPDSSY
jgi:hypothetical protein